MNIRYGSILLTLTVLAATANGSALGAASNPAANTSIAEPVDLQAAASGITKQPDTPGFGASSASSQHSNARYNLKVEKNQAIGPSPLLDGVVQSVPEGTSVPLQLYCNLNSEINQVGDEVFAQVSADVKDEDGNKVLVPGGWYAHGLLSSVGTQKRGGRDGFLEVEFDKLISPDGNIELPFRAKMSNHKSAVKQAAKIVAVDSGYMGIGAAAGAILSVQMTGLPTAIATHGISVGVGAGVGAGIGLIGALKRKGKIASFYPGDQMKLVMEEPISLPGFNPIALPSAAPRTRLKDMDLLVNDAHFRKDPNGDSHSRLLTLDLSMQNNTKSEYSFFDLAVVSDLNQRYYPSMLGGLSVLHHRVAPNSRAEGTVCFSVDSPKHKYWLVLLNHAKGQELTRVPIN